LNIKAESIAKEISQVNALWQQVFA
jgi:hypothetical protein